MFRLPSGLELRHFTAAELDFLYREVYEDRVYLRNGVSLRPGDTVVDVGANTGLFTLLASELVGAGGRVVALEPLPATFAVLEANVAAHAAWCAGRGQQVCAPVLLNCGAGAEGQDSATFTTYSDSASGWSTMYPDDGEARVGRALGRVPPLRPLLRAAGSLYVAGMLSGQRTWSCRLAPLSAVIREQQLERIDLLKCWVEG
ncbi:hypothetical protein GPECTOR_50g581 [Gonium pectorale]|uniref:Methyltransferase FkbM domain-containing protein n=1 Tax=Gonium pectorale TaxID=33097 RepID=A0A150G7I3_GONPE|nr:hypothetical protein GPECTOR_50g581 [Gonium pectorale]|eukprot:KXZ45788.1 hypothetical protein GPECTOR_50g581 [Gonium pectorale]